MNEQIIIFEGEARKKMEDQDTKTFHVAENVIRKGTKKQREVAKRFYQDQ
ncbi:MAG: hypothetical protein KAJ33_09000 [Thermoplasmata archaeon]|nr:hypothetical protein [Thermoplasmata archaeon]